MTSIAQIITELVHRGEIALAEELTEILHMTPEDIELVTSQEEEGGGDEEPPPEDPTPLIPEGDGVTVKLDYAGQKYVIRMVVDGNVLYWSQKLKLWVDDEDNATRYDTKKKAEKATKQADKSYERKYEGKEPKPEPKAPPPPPPAKKEEPPAKDDKADEEPEEKPEKKKVPPQFLKKDDEAKAMLVEHLRDAGYHELAGAISGDLSQK